MIEEIELLPVILEKSEFEFQKNLKNSTVLKFQSIKFLIRRIKPWCFKRIFPSK